mgnify:FL=1
MHDIIAKTTLTAITAVCAFLPAKAQTAVDSIDIAIDTPGATLAATLTMPAHAKPRAAAVLVSGSGAQDRDETIMGHKPFRAIARHLAENGYAVLRYDDRGAGQSSPLRGTETTDTFAADAAAALAALDSICGHGIPAGYIGHSEGATIAIRNAADPRCRFIITLGTPAMAGDSIILTQGRAMLRGMGAESQWNTLEPELRRRYDMLKSDLPSVLLKSSLYADIVKSQPLVAEMPELRQKAMAEIDAMCSPWYRAMLRYNPEADIRAVTIPWLAVGGTLDTQVIPENQDIISRLNPRATTVTLPGINHLMLSAKTGLPAEYPTLTGDIDPAVLDTITRFLNQLP